MQIYTLSCPITLKVKYIGFTSRLGLEKRYKEHLRDKRKCKRNSWIKSLLKKNLYPIIEHLDSCNKQNWQELEQYWISQFKCWGFNLLNQTVGGEGRFGYKCTEEQKFRNSLRNKGKVLSQETKDKISKTQKGKIITEKTRQKISRSHIGMTNSEESRKKISDGNKGKTITEETKRKISKSLKGRKKEFKERDKCKKTILQFDKSMKFIREYKSISIASKETGILRTAIINNLKNLTKTSGNFIWKYKTN